MNKEFPCFCGHPRQWHERLLPHDDVDYCLRCADKGDYAYHYYAPDNLRFLEVKSAEQEKV